MSKKSIAYLVAGLLTLSLAGCGNEQSSAATENTTAAEPTKKPLSPHRTAMASIGDTHIHIDYSSPGVRGRVIWGGLVSYGEVWVTGAHSATSIDFSKDVKIGGQIIPAGKYAFFTIPGEKEWTLILNKNYEQHLADDYSETEDVVRLVVQPEVLTEPIESLTYEVDPGENGKGAIHVMWEKVKVTLPVEEA